MFYNSKKNDEDCIMVTPHGENHRKCYIYELEQDDWISFAEYSDKTLPECHSSAIDQKSDLSSLSPRQVTPMHACPRMMHYFAKKENEECIMLPQHNENLRKCYKCDFDQDDWICFTEYPDEMLHNLDHSIQKTFVCRM